ncbi:nucleoside-diphosphate sugar epimerase/dehydratase [Fulvimarina sp. 2208YS6-2-32]|uniref:Nucleoside-diphosphate sugar epimerase/dehydratase n=1 Tax=Fulvimarina uroteuthidis TaxID=3098149 RepID=A0ABU5HZY2_9HYPH|nr:nucleoside-diphosphate sugar epimerase/dehydratase [Fulvimarina sp. 2208YS6-2-32]MDY8108652.1 nucleoside-diphosphate sugar epimerase/dehydratase [Fulvimarina sp. 2208YS6-2-32]
MDGLFASTLLTRLRSLRLPRASLRRLGVVHDILVSFLAITIAMALSWGLTPLLTVWQIWPLIGIFTGLCAIVFPLFSLNSGAWRYASLLDVVSIVKAATVAIFIFLGISFFVFRGAYVPRTALVMAWFILIVGLGGPRLFYRLMKEGGRRSLAADSEMNEGSAILVYGYTDNADLFVRNARRAGRGHRIVGILDERGKNRKRQLHGVHVLGGRDDLQTIVAKRQDAGLRQIRELVVADAELPAQTLSDLVATAAPLKITVKRLPDISRTGTIDENAPIEPQPIELEDLLSRKVVDLDLAETGRLLFGTRIAVTGAGGSIGSELVRQIARFEPSCLILVESNEFNLWSIERQLKADFPKIDVIARTVDVRHKTRIDRLFADVRPQIVFHAAAMKHVPIVEDNPIEGIETNLLGTRNVADAALAHGSRAFVMVSTDKAVNPTNVMGASKRAAEAYCQSLDLSQDETRFMTVRFGNVLGSTGSVVPLFQSQIQRGGPLTVTDPNIVRFFMTIPEASRLILHAASHGMNNSGSKGLIYVLDMGKPLRIAELAERLIQLAGLRPHIDIAIEFTGLRKGEKLYEELFSTEEIREETGRKGLMFARSRVLDVQLLSRNLKTVEAAIEAGETGRAVECLKRIVPEFDAISFHQAGGLLPTGTDASSLTLPAPARPVGE